MDTHISDVPHRNPAETVADFESRITEHEQLVEATTAISRLRTRYRGPGQRKLAARALLVVGAPGSGKSTILESYMDKHGQVEETPDGDIRRVIALEMPHSPGRKQVVAAILRALGYPARDDWDTNMILDRISTQLREQRVELLLIDEAHHIVENRKEEAEEDVSEFLKSLLNRSGTQLVLFGLPMLLGLKEYPQLDRRLEASVVIEPYSWDTLEGRGEFTMVVDLMEEAMDLPEPSGLSEHRVAVRLYCVTGGHVGLVSKYLSEAFRRALESGLPKIDLTLLGQIHSDFTRRYKTQELSDDFNAAPKRAKREMDSAKNPFLVDDKKLLPLWKAMKAKRDKMVTMANRRHARATRMVGTGAEPSAF
ncbi:MAG: hypothetical protein CL627_10140 [Aurantimonas sp.]|nr:hypothetical protein [Aurantimonas sp.]